jgi:hypothetical protein
VVEPLNDVVGLPNAMANAMGTFVGRTR